MPSLPPPSTQAAIGEFCQQFYASRPLPVSRGDQVQAATLMALAQMCPNWNPATPTPGPDQDMGTSPSLQPNPGLALQPTPTALYAQSTPIAGPRHPVGAMREAAALIGASTQAAIRDFCWHIWALVPLPSLQSPPMGAVLKAAALAGTTFTLGVCVGGGVLWGRIWRDCRVAIAIMGG